MNGAALNRAVSLLPQVDDDTLPCVEIGGVQVYVYIDRVGRLRVSVDTEGSVLPGRPDGSTPMVICVNDAVVWNDAGPDRPDVPDDRSVLHPFRGGTDLTW